MTLAATLRDSLLAHDQLQPEATLLIAPETNSVLSYGQFALETRQLAARYASLGLRQGDHVGFCCITDTRPRPFFWVRWLRDMWSHR